MNAQVESRSKASAAQGPAAGRGPAASSASARTASAGPGRRRGHGHGGMGPVEKPKDMKGTLIRLLAFIGRQKVLLFTVLVFALLSTAFNIVGPKVLSLATTELFNGVTAKIQGTGGIDFWAIQKILMATMGLYALSAGSSFVQSWVMSSIAQNTAYELRRQIDLKFDRLPMGYFERNSTGDVLSRITNDVDTLGQSLNQGVTQLVTSVATLVGVLVMMLSISWKLTLVTIVILPVSMVLLRLVIGRSQRYFVQQQQQLGEINGRIEETFSGHVVVKAFNREQAAIEGFQQQNDKLYESAWKSQFISGLMMPIMNMVSNAGYVVVAVLGSVMAVRGVITVGDIQAFVQYVKNFTQPIQQLSQVANVLQSMAAAAERVFEFLDEKEAEDWEAKAEAAVLQGEVEFKHVRFGYDPEAPVIRDFNAKVRKGQTVAIVGPTGAGKTTLVKLLMRFYEVDDGAITVDGYDIREFDRGDLRSIIGMVLQDAWLYHGTIRENIRYGRLDATDEEVEAAAKAAFAHGFISTLPEGYDTMINEDATNISQGQRQLLTIARAILADRQMLVLDEATSSVDTRTEQRIQDAMDNLMKGRTSFVIAHRLSTIRNADLILYMENGDIVEQGTHNELLALGGSYAHLYNCQFEEHN